MKAYALLPLSAALALSALACTAAPAPEATDHAASAEYAGRLYTVDEIAAYAKSAGLPCSAIVVATAVAMGESEGYAGATHYNGYDGSVDRGLWQINSTAWPMYGESCVFDPACNARAMAAISGNGSNWQPWLAYTNGRYQMFYAEAEAAYARGVVGCGGAGEPATPGGDPGGASEPSPPGGGSGAAGGGSSATWGAARA